MRMRTIVALVVAGLLLVVLGGRLGRRTAPGAEGAGGSRPTTVVPSATTPDTAPAQMGSSASTSPGPATSAPFSAGRQLTDRLEREQPLARVLPHDTAHYGIDYRVAPDRSLELEIRLYAVLNDADQLAQYEEELRRYKAEALEFIRAHGEDPAAYRISYEPPEAASL